MTEGAKTSAAAFKTAEALRVQAASQELWDFETDGIRLPADRRAHSLHPALRDTARQFFADHDIKWWTATGESPGQPTSLLRSSQIACVNHLEPFRHDAGLAIALGAALGLDVQEPVRVDGGYLTYEWIGQENHLGESKWGKRGSNCTSLDAFAALRLASGEVTGVAIEWKYTETPKRGCEAISEKGVSRVETYRGLVEDQDSPIMLKAPLRIESLFYDPYTQLLRQTLLAWQMAEKNELAMTDWIHVHVIPDGNAPLRRPAASLTADGADVADHWRAVLKRPDRYRLMTPGELLGSISDHAGPPGWREWLRSRYET